MSHTQSRQLLTRRNFLHLIVYGATSGLMSGLSASPLSARESSLKHQVNAYIQKLRRAGVISPDERTAWSVYDFTTDSKLVSINEDLPLQAASMIKPFLAQAYFIRHKADSRNYPYDEQVRLKLEEMIGKSDNEAANFIINRVAYNLPINQRPREVERVLKGYAGGIFRHTSIVEFIPHNGRSYRNMASAHDYSRFLYAMFRDRLPFVNEIKHYMGLTNHNRIQDGVDEMPQSIDLYHKSGTTAHVCGDMGVVMAMGAKGDLYPYTFIGIIQKDSRASNYGSWMRHRGNIIRDVSGLVYTFMRERHGLVG